MERLAPWRVFYKYRVRTYFLTIFLTIFSSQFFIYFFTYFKCRKGSESKITWNKFKTNGGVSPSSFMKRTHKTSSSIFKSSGVFFLYKFKYFETKREAKKENEKKNSESMFSFPFFFFFYFRSFCIFFLLHK